MHRLLTLCRFSQLAGYRKWKITFVGQMFHLYGFAPLTISHEKSKNNREGLRSLLSKHQEDSTGGWSVWLSLFDSYPSTKPNACWDSQDIISVTFYNYDDNYVQ